MPKDEKVELHRGLRNVYIDRSECSFIDGRAGVLIYRGYNIHDLAEKSTFEETSYLLLHGTLPNAQQLRQFNEQLKADRGLPDEVSEIIRLLKHAHPMDVLRTGVSALSAFDEDMSDNSPEASLRRAVRLTAMVPTIVATHDRVRNGKEPVTPDPQLQHGANFLYMLFGEKPATEDATLIDKDLLLHIEHGLNASTFATRVATSTKADMYAAIATGIAVLKGPLHGGAAEAVMKMVQEIGSVENARAYITDLRKRGEPVMGFGHAVYRTLDPRSVHLKSDAADLGRRRGQPLWFEILEEVTRVMEPYARRGVAPNVDLWTGAIYYLLGIPEDLFIPMFAMGRIPGWAAHVIEQNQNNILLRPRLLYVGPKDLEYVPVEQRG